MGISQVKDLKHESAVGINASARYTDRFVEAKMLKRLKLGCYGSTGGADKFFNGGIFVTALIYVFKVLLNTVRGIRICLPRSLYFQISRYRS